MEAINLYNEIITFQNMQFIIQCYTVDEEEVENINK